MDPETRLRELDIALPAPSAPVANYVKWVRTGNLVYLSGHGPTRADGTTLPSDIAVEIEMIVEVDG